MIPKTTLGVKVTEEIYEQPRVFISGYQPLTASEWEGIMPRALWTLIDNETGGELWMGGTDDEQDIRYHRFAGKAARWVSDITVKDFDAVATLYAVASPVDWFVVERRWGVPDADIYAWNDAMYYELGDMVRDMSNRILDGQRVLIRCQAGINRSGLVTALILMRQGLTAAEAIEKIRSRRSKVCLANSSFVEFLSSEKAQEIIAM